MKARCTRAWGEMKPFPQRSSNSKVGLAARICSSVRPFFTWVAIRCQMVARHVVVGLKLGFSDDWAVPGNDPGLFVAKSEHSLVAGGETCDHVRRG